MNFKTRVRDTAIEQRQGRNSTAYNIKGEWSWNLQGRHCGTAKINIQHSHHLLCTWSRLVDRSLIIRWQYCASGRYSGENDDAQSLGKYIHRITGNVNGCGGSPSSWKFCTRRRVLLRKHWQSSPSSEISTGEDWMCMVRCRWGRKAAFGIASSLISMSEKEDWGEKG